VPFIVLGDFNRHMDGKDQLWAALSIRRHWCGQRRVVQAPAGSARRSSIIIIAGGAAREWMQLPTLRVLHYRESGG